MKMDSKSQGNRYYQLVAEKNIEEVKKMLHPDVEFYGPLASLKGKDPVIEATTNFMEMFSTLTIHAKFGDKDQAMIVYAIDIPEMMENFPGASLLNFRDGLIIRIQLFYDGSHFTEVKEEIFSESQL